MVVFCNGMVRSGSTLQYNITRLLVESAGVGMGIREIEKAYPEGHPAIEAFADALEMYVLPTHGLEDRRYAEPDRILELAMQGSIKITYVHRDVRDVVVSLRTKWGMNFEQCVKLVDGALESYAWLQPHAEEPWVLMQRYDELTGDLAAGARDIALFLEVGLPDEAVAQIADTCSMDKAVQVMKRLRRQIVVSGAHNANSDGSPLPRDRARLVAGHADPAQSRKLGFVDEETLLHYNHISPHRGQEGVWRTKLTQEESDLLHGRYGNWLAECGYVVGDGQIARE
jgi:hypothetical protein